MKRWEDLRAAVERRDGETVVRTLASDDGPAASAALGAWVRQAAGAATAIAVAIEAIPQGEVLAAAEGLLAHEDLLRPEILLAVVSRGGRRAATRLRRRVLAGLHGRGAAFDAVYAATTIRDEARRREFIERVRGALGEDARLAALAASVADFSPPAGHEVVRRDVGSGKTSRVHLVRRTADGVLFAWKVPADDSAETREDMAALVGRSREWIRLGVSRSAVDWAPDRRTLLQRWVRGPSLRAAISRSPEFLADAADARRAALVEFLRRLASHATFVSGLNAQNLLFDGGAWVVIDSGHVRRMDSASEAWELQRGDCLKKWTRGEGVARRAEIETFLARTDALFALPAPRLTLRRALRRLRRATSS